MMMPARRWLVLFLLVGALVGVQAFVLDRRPETIEENRYRGIAELPAGDVVPTYIASLFFGSFRAVAIDVLWIQLKRVEEEKRWYERREILKMISYFQPRNPEVWAMLGWHSAYNVANGFTEPDRSWEWIRFGLEWLREGVSKLPDSPYLKHEIGFTLMHKPSWRTGKLDYDLLRRIEEDAELQRLLRPAGSADRPWTAFELAISWYGKARADVLAMPERHYLTPAGLYLYPDTMDGYIREAMYFQGMYEWHMDRWDSAKGWFLRAQEHAERMVREYGTSISSINLDLTRFFKGLPQVVDLDRRAREGRPEDVRALLEGMQKLIVDESGPWDPLDRGFLWREGDPAAPLNTLKQAAAGGRDPQECNDDFKLSSTVEEGSPVLANMEPEGLDLDVYMIMVRNPREGAPPDEPPAAPIPVVLRFQRPPSAGLDLKVTVFSRMLDRILEADVKGRKEQEIRFEAPRYEPYFVKVEPVPTGAWPADTSYAFGFTTGR